MLTTQVDNLEALREALLNLERLREQEKTARQQMEVMVGGLHVLNDCQSVYSMYREILGCLHGLIDFDSAAVLVENFDGHLSTVVASDDRLRYKHVPIKGVFERCLNGRATTLTDISKVPDWPEYQSLSLQHSSDINLKQHLGNDTPLASALLVALPSLKKRMILVCASETPSKLKRKELKLLESFTPLATQAMRRAVEMEKLNYLVKTLDHQAHFDLLTGLPNRTLLEQKLNAIESSDENTSVLFLDLDNFKTVNDTFGHAVGDVLLSEVAFRMSALMEENDTVARLGGDEFALIIRSKVTKKSLEALCEELLEAIRLPIFLRNGRIVCSASIGVLFSKDRQSASQINMQKADIAMYEAKKLGRNRYCFFDDEMRSQVQAEFEIESQLLLAIKLKRFHLVYQPIVSARSLSCDRLEVLVRWGDGDKAEYGPQLFVPIAEKTGDIIELGKWITQQALYECREWLASSVDKTLCINVSQVQLQRVGFAQEFIDMIDVAKVDYCQVELELSENIIADSIDTVVSNNISILNDLGIKLAFDDFGTGNSSLLHLQNFPGTCLKIDKSFIDNIASCKEQRQLVAGMIEFAHHMNMDVVAEGVETESQLDILVDSGADLIQGYVVAKPSRAESVFALLRQWERSELSNHCRATGT